MTGNAMVSLDYDLHSLPTAQHKAGLAGLILAIESMKIRGIEPLPQITELTSNGATIAFTQESMQALFDDFYDALTVEVARKNRWPNQQEKRIEELATTDDAGSAKTEKLYIYEIDQPKGKYLTVYYPDEGEGPWIKLWRDMLWGTLRGIPKTRNPYKERLQGNPVSLAAKSFEGLLKSEKARLKGQILTDSISSALFIGAQSTNAEKVPFVGTNEQNLLLHFWTVAALYFVPRILKRDGKRENKGYVIVIPEPADLCLFLEDIKTLLKALDPEISGFRPRAALIDVPEEGGLEYLYNMALNRVRESELAYSIASVEFYHLQKQGNNIKTLGNERIIPNSSVLEDYAKLRDSYSNPLYKTMRIGNLLAGKPWYTGADALFSTWPREIFVSKPDDPPKYFFSFGGDLRKKFRAIEEEQKHIGGDTLTEHTDDRLALHVYRLIRAYVNHKCEAKSGRNYDDFKNNKDEKGRIIYPREYLEARGRLCTDAFLAMRGRREQNFIEYFTGTICSVPQWLPEDDYLAVSQALINDWEKVKTLSMLALSAHSYTGKAS
jgi:CRISPR-associated protein Cmx8